jgi:hypothetical protein
VPKSRRLPHALGSLGVINLITESKHLLEAIREPFVGCTNFAGFIDKVESMNQATFIGVCTAAVLLSVSLGAPLYALWDFGVSRQKARDAKSQHEANSSGA